MSIFNINKHNVKQVAQYEKTIEDYISKFFPGWPWAVTYNKHTNHFDIINCYISLEYGVKTLPINKYYSWSEFDKHIKKICGELLERASLPTVAKDFDMDMWQAKVERDLGAGNTLSNLDKSK